MAALSTPTKAGDLATQEIVMQSPSMYGRESGRISNASKRFDEGMDTPSRKALGALNAQKLAATAAQPSPSPKAGRKSPRDAIPRLTKRAAAAALHNHQVDPVSELSSWFQAGATREQVKVLAKALASDAAVGSFLVREKNSSPNQFALMVKEKRLTLLTFLVKRVSLNGRVGYRIEGAPRAELFGTLAAFVSFYSKRQSSTLGVRLVCIDSDAAALVMQIPGSQNNYTAQIPQRPKAKHVRSFLRQVHKIVIKPDGTPAKVMQTMMVTSPEKTTLSPEDHKDLVFEEEEFEGGSGGSSRGSSRTSGHGSNVSPLERPFSSMSTGSILKKTSVIGDRRKGSSPGGQRSTKKVSFHTSVNRLVKPVSFHAGGEPVGPVSFHAGAKPGPSVSLARGLEVDVWGLPWAGRARTPLEFETVNPTKEQLATLAARDYARSRALTPVDVSPGRAIRIAAQFNPGPTADAEVTAQPKRRSPRWWSRNQTAGKSTSARNFR